MSEPNEIRVNMPFRGQQLAEFLAIKEHLGIQTNADVVRYLVHRHAQALRRRARGGVRRARGTRESATTAGDARTAGGARTAPLRQHAPARDVGAGGIPPQGEGATTAGNALRDLCLNCPLPECDEGDPRCPYQRATGERAQQRARTRAYMRRVRQK